MAHITLTHTWHQPGSVLHRATAAVQKLWLAYQARRAERATIQLLHSLDDRALKDIGIDRSEIESVAHNDDRDRHADTSVTVERNTAHRPAMCA